MSDTYFQDLTGLQTAAQSLVLVNDTTLNTTFGV